MLDDTARGSVSRVLTSVSFALAVSLASGSLPLGSSTADAADGLIRGKQPDRGTYQSPVLVPGRLQKVTIPRLESVADDSASAPSGKLVPAPVLVEDGATVIEVPSPIVPASYESAERHSQGNADADPRIVRGANHPVAVATTDPSDVRSSDYTISTCSCPSCQGKQGNAIAYAESFGSSDNWYPADLDMGSCDASYCDSMGCDSIGFGRWRCAPDEFFGSIELMLMFRKGDLLPPLVTTGPDTDQNTAGELGQAGTEILAGADTVLQDLSLGGRLTIGRWLDSCKDRSWVARAWFASEEGFDFSATQDNFDVLTRPFFNVTDGQIPAQDTQIIAFTGLANGEIGVEAKSHVYGADFSMRQLWAKHCGATIDLLYGYQYLGVDESLAIRSRSTSINNNFAPIGSVLSVTDSFDIENQFHGGQIGFSTFYRERCWSFSSLVKVGFGNLEQRAVLTGETTTRVDSNIATNPNGLLVRSTNSGTRTNNTFAWAPELDFTLGWQKYPSFDVTFGYHIVALTDALQVSGVIDPDLAVNFATTGVASPSSQFRFDTFYVQGIHFGLAYVH